MKNCWAYSLFLAILGERWRKKEPKTDFFPFRQRIEQQQRLDELNNSVSGRTDRGDREANERERWFRGKKRKEGLWFEIDE